MRALVFAAFAILQASASNNATNCGSPVRKLKWTKPKKTTYKRVDTACDCRLLCEVVHAAKHPNYVSWFMKTSNGRCTCVDADFKMGRPTLKLKNVKHHSESRGKAPKFYSGETEIREYRSRVVKTIDAVTNITAQYMNPWSLIVTAEDKSADVGYQRLYEVTSGTTTSEPAHVASQSKWIAAYAIMREMVAGNLTLDDPVCPYVDGWNCTDFENGPDPENVTIKNLLAFQSGATAGGISPCQLPEGADYANATYMDCVEAAIEFGNWTEDVMDFFTYNHNHLLLAGMAMVGLSNKTLDEILEDVNDALGLEHTTWDTAKEIFGYWGVEQVNLIDLGATMKTSPDDLEKFHMGYLMQTLPGIPEELYKEWHMERWTNETRMRTWFDNDKMFTGDSLGVGSYALGHWIDCPLTLANNNGGPTMQWPWCHEYPMDHNSEGAFGALAQVDVERRFMVQSVPHPEAVLGGGENGMASSIMSPLVTRVVKGLVEPLFRPALKSISSCFSLCLLDHTLNWEPTANWTGDADFWTVERYLGVSNDTLEGLQLLGAELQEAVGCEPCPEDFDPTKPF